MDWRNVWTSMRVMAIVAAFGTVLGATPARADDPQCTFTMTNLSFNTVDPAGAQPALATGTLTYACVGDSREILRICPSFGINGTPRFMTDSADHKLLFDLYSDQGMATIWGTWFSKTPGPSIEVPLGRSERTMGSAQVYGRIQAGQQGVPAGSYQLMEKRNDTVIAYGYASKGECKSLTHSTTWVHTPFTIYANVVNGGAPGGQAQATPPPPPGNDQGGHKSGGGIWSKLAANAQYQQAKQNGASDAQLAAIKNGTGGNGDKPPCRSEDPNAHLVNGQWVGPNCLTEPDNGHYVTDEEAKKQNDDLRKQQAAQTSQSDQEKRAEDIESHSCMTSDGADKANTLAADCEKVTSAPHKGCNIQENTCDEIRSATRKGCNGLGAEGPDWCLTKYN